MVELVLVVWEEFEPLAEDEVVDEVLEVWLKNTRQIITPATAITAITKIITIKLLPDCLLFFAIFDALYSYTLALLTHSLPEM